MFMDFVYCVVRDTGFFFFLMWLQEKAVSGAEVHEICGCFVYLEGGCSRRQLRMNVRKGF